MLEEVVADLLLNGKCRPVEIFQGIPVPLIKLPGFFSKSFRDVIRQLVIVAIVCDLSRLERVQPEEFFIIPVRELIEQILW
jgi:hypothetical protein